MADLVINGYIPLDEAFEKACKSFAEHHADYDVRRVVELRVAAEAYHRQQGINARLAHLIERKARIAPVRANERRRQRWSKRGERFVRLPAGRPGESSHRHPKERAAPKPRAYDVADHPVPLAIPDVVINRLMQALAEGVLVTSIDGGKVLRPRVWGDPAMAVLIGESEILDPRGLGLPLDLLEKSLFLQEAAFEQWLVSAWGASESGSGNPYAGGKNHLERGAAVERTETWLREGYMGKSPQSPTHTKDDVWPIARAALSLRSRRSFEEAWAAVTACYPAWRGGLVPSRENKRRAADAGPGLVENPEQ